MEKIAYNELPTGLMPAMFQLQQYVDHSGLDHQLLELMRFRVSLINNCAFCLDMHFKEAVAAGETPLRLFSLSAWRETPYYTPKEQAVLEFAETLTKMPADVHTEHLHDDLLQYFNKAEIAHLTLAIAMINSWNRLTRSFGTVPGNYKVGAKAKVQPA